MPRVYPAYGDNSASWAQSTFSAMEFIELEYPDELIITKLNIYETFHAGAVIRIKLKNRFNIWETVWETSNAQNLETSRIFSPVLRSVTFKTKFVRLDLDCTVANNWCEIDAVG
jgi:hypothetical protein